LSYEIAKRAGAHDEEDRTLLEWAAAEFVGGDGRAAQDLYERAAARDDHSLTGDLAVRRVFVGAMLRRVQDADDLTAVTLGQLHDAAALASSSGLRLWAWRCYAALAGLASKAGDASQALAATQSARNALRDLLDAIKAPALQESYVMLPDPRLFLAWCERDVSAIEESLPREL